MNSNPATASRSRTWSAMFAAPVFAMLFAAGAAAQTPAVSFFKFFGPDTIGPGSVSTLTFEIRSSLSEPITDLAFTDTLPAGLTIADPAFATDGCNGSLDAPPGGSTITFSGGSLGAPPAGTESSSCQITVDVTGTTVGDHQNVSGSLTSSAGDSGSAVDTLTIDPGRPGFSKNFTPASVQLGGDSTLTFTVDNSANASDAFFLAFDDDLPAGLEIEDPANTTNTCEGTLSAPAGDRAISLFDGFVSPGSICTISVDVTTTAVGTLDNRSSNLTSSPMDSVSTTAARPAIP